MRVVRCTGLFAVALLVAGTALADGRPSADRLRVMFEQATDALDQGDLARARQLYLAVWEHQQTYDVATNLTAVEYQLGNFTAAGEFARSAIRLFPPSEDPRARVQLESLLEQARREFGTATVEAPAGAVITLDGRALGQAPLEEVFVPPGSHRFEANDGVRSVAKEVTVGKGAAFTVALSFGDPARQSTAGSSESDPVTATPVASSPPPAADPEVDRAAGRSRARPVVIVAGGVLTAASVGVHVALRLKAARLDDDADRAWARADWSTGTGGCRDTDHEACDRLSDVLDRRDAAGLGSNIALGAAVVFGAATVGAVVWPRRRAHETGWQVVPWTSAAARGVVVEGKFR